MTQDVARLGALRPPRIYLASICAGVFLEQLAPLLVASHRLAAPLGASLAAISVALLAWSVAKFRAAGTPVPAREPTTAIVRTGPYRFSRNPIYLAYSLFHLGLAIGMNSAWLLATLAVALWLIHYRVIPREEQYLAQKFGAEYLDYKAAVGRWW
jgi:protein-S-isoprenylcysteine O-methyltransferase Ste14